MGSYGQVDSIHRNHSGILTRQMHVRKIERGDVVDLEDSKMQQLFFPMRLKGWDSGEEKEADISSSSIRSASLKKARASSSPRATNCFLALRSHWWRCCTLQKSSASLFYGDTMATEKETPSQVEMGHI